jgi:hypothetical protein
VQPPLRQTLFALCTGSGTVARVGVGVGAAVAPRCSLSGITTRIAAALVEIRLAKEHVTLIFLVATGLVADVAPDVVVRVVAASAVRL